MSVIVQTRIDPKIKEEASEALRSMGLSLSDAVRLMLIKTAREKALPFEIWNPNSTTISAIEEAKMGLTEKTDIDKIMVDFNEGN